MDDVAANRAEAEAALRDPRVVAFLQALVRPPESGTGPNGYGLRFGDTTAHPTITDFSRHPGSRNGHSDAGAYQFVESTWNWLAPQVGVADFQPHSQDIVAARMLAVLGALPLIYANDIPGAIARARVSSGWTSLPGGARGQGRSMASSLAAYNTYLGGGGQAPVIPPAASGGAPFDMSTFLIIAVVGLGLFALMRARD